jgi:hypothetical protein
LYHVERKPVPPIVLAAEISEELLDAFLDAGADPSTQGESGTTALARAIRSKKAYTIGALIREALTP